MGLLTSGNLTLIGGIFSLIFGIIVLIFPKILNYLVGIWLIVIGAIALYHHFFVA